MCTLEFTMSFFFQVCYYLILSIENSFCIVVREKKRNFKVYQFFSFFVFVFVVFCLKKENGR